MYLSQPRDLINSMSTGCSRGSIVVLPLDNHRHESSAPSTATDNFSASHTSLTSVHFGLKPHDSAELQTPPSSGHSDGHAVPLVHTPRDALTKALYSSDGITASRWFRAQHFQKIWERLDRGSPSSRPPHPYTELIKLCILKRREGKLTLKELYEDLEAKFLFYAASSSGKGWRNTIRHNLSTQPYFVKLEREPGQLGKGHYWAYCPDLEKPTSLAQSSIMQMTSLWSLSSSSTATARSWTQESG
uniref:Fork-head domain-containing protein n=1 Tax=Kalmanozyma brasiliensis (strain GHG001) TaxID=1365824 RepID=V5GNG7_KALBG